MEIKEIKGFIGTQLFDVTEEDLKGLEIYEEAFYNYDYDFLRQIQCVYMLDFSTICDTLNRVNNNPGIFDLMVNHAEAVKNQWKHILGKDELAEPLSPNELKMYRGISTAGTRYTRKSTEETESILKKLEVKHNKFISQMYYIYHKTSWLMNH